MFITSNITRRRCKGQGKAKCHEIAARLQKIERLLSNLTRPEVRGRHSETIVPGLIVRLAFTLGTYVSHTIMPGMMSTLNIRGRYKTSC